jgi:DNA-binding PadR family transcriptional regulator
VLKPPRLSLGSVAILHAVASGSRFGFDIMDTTGLTSGSVYPALERLESLGLLESSWEDERAAHREKRPPRRYFTLTAAGEQVLAEALERHRGFARLPLAAPHAGPGRR